jgi:thiosulfate reductase cytochrome b subunit
MRLGTAGCVTLFLAALVGTAAATGSGKVLMYGGAGQGKVLFDGRTHASAGLACAACHTQIFEMRKRALITMADHTEAKSCFVCHNGQKAFADCAKCHRKV